MEKPLSTILVTWDFTVVSEHAFEHAQLIAKRLKHSITLLHVVKKIREKDEVEKKLIPIAGELEKKSGLTVNYLVVEGTIFKTISKTSGELNASLVIMGTHGIKGMQKVTGSWALKVIVDSPVPFIVVQHPPKNDNYQKIAIVVDYKKENKEKARWVGFVHESFGSSFHIIKPHTNDKIFIKRINANLLFARRFLETNRIEYEVETSKGEESFPDEIADYANRIGADLIMVMTTKNIGITDYALGAHEQYVIANKYNIPVMCINPDPKLTKLGSFR